MARGDVARGSLFQDLGAPRGDPSQPDEERVDVLSRFGGGRVERIVSRGHRSPDGFWYDQGEWEWVVVVSGRARLELEGEGELALSAGDWLEIPARVRHRVTWTDPSRPTIWLAIFRAPQPGSRDRDPAGG